jgi:hypothetical protein
VPLLLNKEGTWSVTLREVNREFTACECSKLHIEELCDLYCSQYIIRVVKSRKMRWTWLVAYVRERTCANRISVGKRDGKRAL